jgi:hypothetical protein
MRSCFSWLHWVSISTVLLCGCAHQAANRHPCWGNYSVLKSNESLATLNTRANDTSVPDRYRALAAFRLFATCVRPGQSAPEVHKILAGANWLRTAKVFSMGAGTGYSPVEWTPADSAFVILLFPDKEGQSDWRICLVLCGHPLHAPAPPEEALRFLEGGPTLRSEARLKEFALSFVGGIPGYTARSERFSQRGLDVYDW